MTVFDRIVLLLTGLIAIYLIFYFVKKQRHPETASSSNIYYILSFAVLLISGLLLIIFGWNALKNDLVAIVAGLIPFGLASGLVAKFFPKLEKGYVGLLAIGLVLIAITRLGDMVILGKVLYPIFHSIAGLTIFFLPLIAVKNGRAKGSFAYVTLGGTLIGLGGIALAFLSAERQLFFFSEDFVLMILAPLLFLTALFFGLGLIKGESA